MDKFLNVEVWKNLVKNVLYVGVLCLWLIYLFDINFEFKEILIEFFLNINVSKECVCIKNINVNIVWIIVLFY